MLSPRLTNCPECANIPNLLQEIDCKLAEYANALFNNVVFMLNQSVPAGIMIQLIAYKRILTYKNCNPDYIYEVSINRIASKVKLLTLGCNVKPMYIPTPTTSTTSTSTTCIPITTTTSSTSTSTSTSTSSSTTTTTTSVDPCLDCVTHDLTIGTQIWTGCNLDVTTYRNGDLIPEVTDPATWTVLTTGAWCYYENNSVNGPTYGKMYNWYAVTDPRGLAPIGYHIPTQSEWTILTTFLGGSTVAGGALKQQGFCHWLSQNTATNSSGFSALGGGNRSTGGGFFGSLGLYGNFWSTSQYNSTASYFLSLLVSNNSATIQVANNIDGQSMRLIKD